MRALPFMLLAALALPVPARAEVWEDPDLPAALGSASLVVIGRAPAAGSSGQPRVRFTVERVLAGEARGAIDVGGLHDPTATSGPAFEPDERVLLILARGRDGDLRTPTPTFGRFPLRGEPGAEQVLFAALRDTFLRLTLPLADYEPFLRLTLGQAPAPEWVERLRAHLRGSGPGETGPARARSYLALETLARAGTPDEELAGVITRYLDPEGPFQLRISALRALARCAGSPVPALLGALERDPEPAVRTCAARLLAGCAAEPGARPALAARLGALLPTAPAEPVRFVGPSDPRLNRWPAPRVALVEALAALGAGPARAGLLAALDDREQPGEVLVALGAALSTLRADPTLGRELAGRLRGDGQTRDLVICRTLEQLTGLAHGQDVSAWRAWAHAGR